TLKEAADRTQSSRLGERCTLLFTLADLQIEAGDLEDARKTLARVGNIGVNDRAILSSMHLKLADIEERLGNRNQAEWERNRAKELQFE
nr:hypothetical protein [Deltaproteobacteria bacterium]